MDKVPAISHTSIIVCLLVHLASLGIALLCLLAIAENFTEEVTVPVVHLNMNATNAFVQVYFFVNQFVSFIYIIDSVLPLTMSTSTTSQPQASFASGKSRMFIL